MSTLLLRSRVIRDPYIHYIHDLGIDRGRPRQRHHAQRLEERLVIGHNTVLNSQIIGSRTSGSPRPWRSDGPVAHFDSQGPDNPWSGNVWDEDGAYIP